MLSPVMLLILQQIQTTPTLQDHKWKKDELLGGKFWILSGCRPPWSKSGDFSTFSILFLGILYQKMYDAFCFFFFFIIILPIFLSSSTKSQVCSSGVSTATCHHHDNKEKKQVLQHNWSVHFLLWQKHLWEKQWYESISTDSGHEHKVKTFKVFVVRISVDRWSGWLFFTLILFLTSECFGCSLDSHGPEISYTLSVRSLFAAFESSLSAKYLLSYSDLNEIVRKWINWLKYGVSPI